MILTGKALEDFENWVNWKYPDIEVLLLGVVEPIFLNALIIEFFDSVGIYINVELDYLHLVWFPSIDNNWAFEEVEFETRQEATVQAIKKANEIYNMEIPKEETEQKRDINTCRYFDIEVGCEREKCICANTHYEEPKQDIIMELEKDPLLKEFDNRVSKNLHILKNKKETEENIIEETKQKARDYGNSLVKQDRTCTHNCSAVCGECQILEPKPLLSVEWLLRYIEDLNNKGYTFIPSSNKEVVEHIKQMQKDNMIAFLKFVFQQDGFDYEQAYNNFLKQQIL